MACSRASPCRHRQQGSTTRLCRTSPPTTSWSVPASPRAVVVPTRERDRAVPAQPKDNRDQPPSYVRTAEACAASRPGQPTFTRAHIAGEWQPTRPSPQPLPDRSGRPRRRSDGFGASSSAERDGSTSGIRCRTDMAARTGSARLSVASPPASGQCKGALAEGDSGDVEVCGVLHPQGRGHRPSHGLQVTCPLLSVVVPHQPSNHGRRRTSRARASISDPVTRPLLYPLVSS